MFLRKYITVISAAALALLLCSCAGRTSEKEEEALPSLVIACDIYEPYTFYDMTGGFDGADAALAKEACRRLGYRAEFKKIKWDEKKIVLESGEADCVWGCFSMAGREEDYLWVGPYAYSNQSVAVRRESDITDVSGLKGKKVAVQAGTKPEKLLLEGSGTTVPKAGKVYCFDEIGETFGALGKGYVDACVGHEAAIRVFVNESRNDYRMLDKALTRSGLGVAFAKGGSRSTAEKLAEVLNKMRADGTTRRIIREYIGTADEIPEVNVLVGD